MKRLGEEYGLPDLTAQPWDPELVKKAVKLANQKELFRDCLRSKVESRITLKEQFKPQFKWSKMEAKARLLSAAGCLKFLSQASGWRSFYRARDISTLCVSRLCSEEDTEDHAKKCKFMYTVWKEEYEGDREKRVAYLVKLNRERRRRFNFPIL